MISKMFDLSMPCIVPYELPLRAIVKQMIATIYFLIEIKKSSSQGIVMLCNR